MQIENQLLISKHILTRYTLLLFFVFANSYFSVQAQLVGGTNEKLAKLYNSGNFESCLLKADNLTYSENTSRDPEPYLYIAMCYYELSKSEDPVIKEDYKDGLKQAIKFTNKFAKKDKEGAMYSDNIGFINELKDIQLLEVKQYFDEPDYKKAASSAKLYDKLNREEDYSILYFVGICEVLSNNISQGSRDLDEAKNKLEENMKTGSVTIDTKIKSLISSGFLKHSEYLVQDNQLEQAVESINFGMKILPNDSLLKGQYNLINNKMNTKKDSIPEKTK